ncbi:MAG: LutC/YkgG family protein [Methyloligellaceae bacterium]
MTESEAAREKIMTAIRTSLGVSGSEAERITDVSVRLDQHTPNLIPERARNTQTENVALFRKMMESQSATVKEIKGIDDVPSAVADYLRDNNLPAAIRMGSDPVLNDLPWTSETALDIKTGKAVATDSTAVSRAFGAAAETGTLFLISGAENPTTLNFLPDTHIVVLRNVDIAGAYEEVWEQIREVAGQRSMPRTVNLISGPSRTGDIEQKIVMGAHGPRRMCILLVGSP